MNEQTVRQLVSSNDWTGFKLGDLRETIRSLVILTLQGPPDPETIAYWRDRCNTEIDFLVYSFALVDSPSAVDDPTKDVDDLVRVWASRPLAITSRRNLQAVYLNTYFFKYIASVELPKLQVAMTNPELPPEQCIDFYITHLLYKDAVEANPGVFFTYEQIPGIDYGRVVALQKARSDLARDIGQIGLERFTSLIVGFKSPLGRVTDADANDLAPVFKSVFLLMTYYVGSNYRRLHDAVTTLLALDMADFRSAFFENLPSVIHHHGGLLPQISLEATLAEMNRSATETPQPALQRPGTPPTPSSSGDRRGIVRVEVFGSTQSGFINNPSVAVHWNGSKVGSVAHAGSFAFEIDAPGELLLKYAVRSRKVRLEPKGQTIRIQLSWDRTWGRLLAEQLPSR